MAATRLQSVSHLSKDPDEASKRILNQAATLMKLVAFSIVILQLVVALEVQFHSLQDTWLDYIVWTNTKFLSYFKYSRLFTDTTNIYKWRNDDD